MSTFSQLQKRRQEIFSIARQYGIVDMKIFGSVARGDDTAQSDIDFLVNLEEGRTLLDLGGALIKFEELLGRKVDLVTERGLHWYLRENVLKEAREL